MLEELRLEPMAAAVAAWHNRLPLAQRVAAAQVTSPGYVVRPVGADARRGRRALRPAFSEDFLPPFTPQQIARWALRHGRDVAGMPAGAPRRDVALDAGVLGPDGTLVPLVVRTASLESQGRVQRVLVGAGKRPAVLGRRWRSAGRLGALAGLFGLAAVSAVLRFAILAHERLGIEDPPAPFDNVAVADPQDAAPVWEPAASEPDLAEPPPPPEPMPQEAAEAPETAASVAAQAPPPPLPASAAAVTAAPSAAASAAPAAAPPAAPQGTARPVDVEPRWGRIDLPRVRPEIVPRKEPSKSVWAIAAPQVRDARTAAKGATRMQQQLAAAGQAGLRVETMAVGNEWRVVGWPFRSRRAAEDALAVLARQGVKAEVVEF